MKNTDWKSQREKEKLHDMMQFSQRFLDTDSVLDLKEITEFMRSLTGAAYVVFNLFEDNGMSFTTKAIAGSAQQLLKAADLLGFNPIGKSWPRDPDRQAKTQQEMVTIFDNLQSLTGNAVSPHLILLTQKTFGIGQVAIIKTMKQDKALGDFTLLMPKGKNIESQELAILFATQVAMFLDRVKYEEDLQKQRKRLEGIIEATNVGTWEWNVKTGETIINQRWAEMVGYTLTELEPTSFETWTTFVHPEDLSATKALLQEVLSGAMEYYNVDYRLKHRDGHWIWVHDQGKVISWTKEGDPILMSGTQADITDRKQVEETLIASKEQLETLSNNIPNGMVYQLTVDPSGNRRFTYVSAGVEQLHGVTQDEVLNNAQVLYEKFLEDDKQKLIQIEERVFKTLEPFVCEARFKKTGGEIRWAKFQSALSKKPDGSIVADGIEIDITDLKIAEEKMLVAAKEADKANLAKNRYLAHMNHEIRTPLNGFIGFLQLMEDTQLDEEQQDYMEHMKLSTNHILSIINNVLDMAKIEAGEIQLINRVFNLEEEIETALAPLHSLAMNNNTELLTTMDKKLPQQVKGDPDRLRQIALNIGGNAVKFTQEGQVHFTIRCLETTEEHHILQMVVEDTGPGMTQETQDKLFLPFYQADDGETPQSKGTGLGMTITRELVELMGGQIKVYSTLGKGTRMEVKLLLRKASDSREDKETSIPKGPRILVVEDNEINQLLIRRFLEKKGHTCKVVSDGQQAVKEAIENTYDLILMDIHLPLMDGREAARQIRSRADICQPRIIAVTAFTNWKDQEACMEAGMDGFIAKPITYEDVGKVLDGTLN